MVSKTILCVRVFEIMVRSAAGLCFFCFVAKAELLSPFGLVWKDDISQLTAPQKQLTCVAILNSFEELDVFLRTWIGSGSTELHNERSTKNSQRIVLLMYLNS